ncbi:MAG TPA: UdgX family uracil-DNA binding protein [Casimicrobiaceae bacterium]|nr:UdgX family uracil-DNA binding protein [Casimicrobiaceae bacterium]
MTAATPFAAWRARARALLADAVPPEEARWPDDGVQASLWGSPPPSTPSRAAPPLRISARLLTLLEDASCHRSAGRDARMYRVLWRATHGEPAIVSDVVDDDVARLCAMQREVRRDAHKMTAFVRFREAGAQATGEPRWFAWYEPQHLVVARVAPFFVERFGPMHWTIATPDAIARWDRAALSILPPDPQLRPPAYDAAYELWLAYYDAIFNPARLNVRAMRSHMPVHFWRGLPEAARIPALVASASERAGRMTETVSTGRGRPARAPTVTAALAGPGDGWPTTAQLDACRRCPLAARATQGVPGAGPRPARVMIVGEQPGDEEDLAGAPFVGPAGRLLRAVLDGAGLDADAAYVTNAVKHFGWEPRGTRRLHKTPAQREVDACRGWLAAEIAGVRPRVIVALGRTALLALLGRALAVGEARAVALRHADGATIVATYHPSAVLRARDDDARARLLDALAEDLARAFALAGRDADAP